MMLGCEMTVTNVSYVLIDRLPTLEEYARLRSEAGWHLPPPEIMKDALANSNYSVVASAERIVGCARVVSDGLYYYLQDVLVARDYRRVGIGTALVKKCMDAILTQAHAGSGCFIGLMTAPPLKGFYAQFGFVEAEPDISFMHIRRL